jgi:hypothetical protein
VPARSLWLNPVFRPIATRRSVGVNVKNASISKVVSEQAHGYPSSPGVYTAEQIAAWRRIADGVHRLGGRIVMQIAHNGRGSLSVYNSDGTLPVGPSAIPYVGKVYTPAYQPLDPETPRALETSEIPMLVEAFTQAARNAGDRASLKCPPDQRLTETIRLRLLSITCRGGEDVFTPGSTRARVQPSW